MDWLEIISLAKDLIVSSAAVTTAVIAGVGLGTWKRQLKGQFEYELSRRILVTLFKYRDAISGVRHPVMWGYEMPNPSTEEIEGMSNEDIRYFGTSRAYQARWERVQTERANLYTDLLQSEVLWGLELKILFKALFDLEHELMMTIQRYLKTTDPSISEREKEAIRKISMKRRDVMYDDFSENGDDFRQEFQLGTKAIEKFLKPKLQY